MGMLLSINKMYPPEMGGVEVVAREVAKVGMEVFGESQVISFNSVFRTVLEEVEGISVHRLTALKFGRSIRIPFGYGRTLKKMGKRASVIIYHFPSFFPEIFLQKSKAPRICFYQADIVGKGLIGDIYNKLIVPRFLNHMDYIVTSSPNLAACSHHLKNRKRIEVIPLGIDTKHFYPVGENVRETIFRDLKCNTHDKIILFVGRLARYKGIKELLEALSLLPDEYKLAVVTKDDTEKLQEVINKLNLNKRVVFYPNVSYEELPKFYRSADVFCMPSTDRGEAFGLVAVEAMACGIPIITTELGTGTSYHNINGVTGRIVKPRDVEALKEAIIEICLNKLDYSSTVIRERAQQFSLEKFNENWKKLLKQKTKGTVLFVPNK
jgi:glycosyltransferase involved in cell wall biosynthesis